METFLAKHDGEVIGTLSGFDRLVFRGTLRPLAYVNGMKPYLYSAGVLLKDFASHALKLTQHLKEASLDLASWSSRPVQYLPSSGTNKEEVARKIAETDGIKEGP